MSERYLSVQELQSIGGNNDVAFAFTPPVGVDLGMLLVDTKKMHSLRMAAGIGQLIVEGNRNEQSVDFSGSVNDDGTVNKVTAVTTTKRSVTSNPKSEGYSNPFYPGGYRPEITVPFNTNEVMRSLGSSKADTAEGHFALELNRTIRSGLLGGSSRSYGLDMYHEVFEKRAAHIALKALAVALGGLAMHQTYFTISEVMDKIGSQDPVPSVAGLVPPLIIRNAISVFMNKSYANPETPVHEHKWSIFNSLGIQLDRIAYSQARIRTARDVISVAR